MNGRGGFGGATSPVLDNARRDWVGSGCTRETTEVLVVVFLVILAELDPDRRWRRKNCLRPCLILFIFGEDRLGKASVKL